MKRTVFRHYAIGMGFAVLMYLGSPVSSLCQKSPTPGANTKQTAREQSKETKPAFVLKVKTTPILNISLKAEKAKVSEVAQELSKQLKTPIFLGPERQNETLTIEFSQLTLEPALQLLSPMVYVDYEIDTGSSGPPKALGIYLFDTNQGEPPLSASVTGSTQSLLVEGNTEDGVETETAGDKKKVEEEPLRVSFQNNCLSVKAKKQPLPLVLLKIGEEIGIPVDIQDDNIATIDAEISKLPVEDAVRQLSPHIRLFLRADLTRAERRALRLVLTPSPKTAQQNP
ncbi:MAG TPA: hypothetical protein VJ875_20795 [Pyrinomonadaceae bacterium]|nr:hypothetical protein [Pyrinomonadaceae bacterium]